MHSTNKLGISELFLRAACDDAVGDEIPITVNVSENLDA
jgi:hypothetical protein